MKHENDVNNMVGCLDLQAVKIYSFMKKIKVYICASYIVFLFVTTENTDFIKNKTCSPCLHSQVKTSAKFVRILEQVKTLDWVSSFYWSALELSQTFASVFTRLWRHGDNILFSNLKEFNFNKISCSFVGRTSVRMWLTTFQI